MIPLSNARGPDRGARLSDVPAMSARTTCLARAQRETSIEARRRNRALVGGVAERATVSVHSVSRVATIHDLKTQTVTGTDKLSLTELW